MTRELSANWCELFVDELTDYAVIMLDVHGAALTWNAGHARSWIRLEEIVGRPLAGLYATSNGAIVAGRRVSLQDALQWGRHETTGRLVRKDGTGFEAQDSPAGRSRIGNQRLVGYGVLAYDVDGGAKRLASIRAECPERRRMSRTSRGKAKIHAWWTTTIARSREAVGQLITPRLRGRLGVERRRSAGGDARKSSTRCSTCCSPTSSCRAASRGPRAGRQGDELRPGLKVLVCLGILRGRAGRQGRARDATSSSSMKPYREAGARPENRRGAEVGLLIGRRCSRAELRWRTWRGRRACDTNGGAMQPPCPYLASGRDIRLDLFRGLALWFIYRRPRSRPTS